MVIAAGLVMSGCSTEEPEPDFKPTLPASKSSSALDGEDETAPVDEDEEAQPNPAASPDLKPPPIPPEIEEKTLKGAEAAARYYIDAFNYGYLAYDSEPIEELSLADCTTCFHHVNTIELLKEQNQRLQGGTVEIEPAAEIYDDGDRVVVEFTATQEPYKVLNTDDSIDKTNKGAHVTMKIMASWEDTSWKIRATDNEKVAE